jgi:ADP-ribose pyrophosphatase YjhB (NUDIX family)
VTPFHDPRQHAVSLAYVVPVEGDCAPQQDALELIWFSPDEAREPAVLGELANGQSALVVQALAHLGVVRT